MKVKFAVSFENDIAPTQTFRGILEGEDPQKMASSAVYKAQQALPRAKWRSFVVVVEKVKE